MTSHIGGILHAPRILALLSWALLGWALLGWASPADRVRAEPPTSEAPVTATVVALDAEQLVLDVGKDRVKVGDTLRLFRTIEVKHPLSGKLLRDRFPNGSARVVQAGDALSIAVPVEAPPRPPAIGDGAERERPAPVVRTVAPQCSECARVVQVQREILELWYSTLGKPIEQRVSLLRAFLELRPASPYRSWLESEITFYSSGQAASSARPIASEAAASALAKVVRALPLERALEGTKLVAGVYVPPETRLRSVRLWLRKDRKAGEYTPLDYALDARGQGRVEVPESFVQAPGFAYFIEATLGDNSALPVLASAAAPRFCTVQKKPGAPVRSNMSRVRAATEYVSFDGLTGRDYYYLFEADFLLRLPTRVLEGLRTGYGHYRGRGGSVKELDELELSPAPAAFTYGYLELVLGLHELFALMPRLEVGLGRPPNESNSIKSQLRAGGQLRVRIGRANGTHLILAGETIPEIGQRAFVGLSLGLLEKFPMAFEVHVTDQPVNTDELGVRAVFELGYRPSPVFALSARASYQGRTINHTGPGLGLAATFDW
jgi:hypothetical protein